MKTIITSLFLIMIYQMAAAQDHFYYYQGNKIPLETSLEKIYIKFKPSLTRSQKQDIIGSKLTFRPLISELNEFVHDDVILGVAGYSNKFQMYDIIKKLNEHESVLIANIFFSFKDMNAFQGISDRFIVRLKSADYLSDLKKLVKETNTTIVREGPGLNRYIIIADKHSQGNALEMANYFYESGICDYAEPDFIVITHPSCANDTYFGSQWALDNTGQYGGTSGIDIQACEAWGITTGRSDIKIAVIDGGVQLNHPDLSANILSGYDATGGGSGGAPQGNSAPHGTACAGIIAASGNNSAGVIGIAHTSTIIPIRIYSTNSDSCKSTITSSYAMQADGIIKAYDDFNADVINISLNNPAASSDVTTAINGAATLGRDNLGTAVIISSGNYNSSTVLHPANVANAIAVGAMSMCGQRKSPSSCDGEGWGSNYGSELSVVAPGVKISTLDISGSTGYSAGVGSYCPSMHNNDYVSGFNGTSSAAPQAAGVMALILSINRCLTVSEARKILELSCDKTGSYCYNTVSGKPNGLWNNEMGYGKINAYKAVQMAHSTQVTSFNVTGTDQGPSSQFQWTLAAGGCAGFAAGVYNVKRHEVRTTVNYSYTQSPVIVGGSTGFTAASPNLGNQFMDIVSISPTSATVRTFVYEVINTISGATISGWAPAQPSSIIFNFTVLSAIDNDLYFQNETETSTEVHNAMTKIEAGRNVTGSLSVGDYTVSSGADITFHAGETVILKEGFYANNGSTFHAYVDPFFTCTQYPSGKTDETDNAASTSIIQHFESSIIESSVNKIESEQLLRNFPNPFNESTTIEYQISSSDNVTISIFDFYGRELVRLKNNAPHKEGLYQVRLEGINLSPGVYYYTLETDNYKETKQMIKTD